MQGYDSTYTQNAKLMHEIEEREEGDVRSGEEISKRQIDSSLVPIVLKADYAVRECRKGVEHFIVARHKVCRNRARVDGPVCNTTVNNANWVERR